MCHSSGAFISNIPDNVNLFYQPHIPDGFLNLDPEESRHCIRVLRKKSGDTIHLTDGKGCFYTAAITRPDPATCGFTIESTTREQDRNYCIHIAISPTRNPDRIEWFVEKSVELGVDRITLLECANSERITIRRERLEKVAVSAMKQSLKAWLPEITGVQKLKEAIRHFNEEQKFIAFVDPSNPEHLKNLAAVGGRYVVLIGPEGDFSTEELNLAVGSGFRKVSLGRSRLRTETAGVAACHILNLINS